MKVVGPLTATALQTWLGGIDTKLSFYLQSEVATGPGQVTVQGILAYPKTEQTVYRAYQHVNGTWQATTAPCYHVIEKIVKGLCLNGSDVWVHKVGFTKFTAAAKLASLKEGLASKGISCQCDGLGLSKLLGASVAIPQPKPPKPSAVAWATAVVAAKPVMPVDPPKPTKLFEAPALEGEPLTGVAGKGDWGKVRDVEVAVTGLYVLEELSLTVDLEKVPANVKDYLTTTKQAYAGTLARNLFDYLSLASMGEARHYGKGNLPGGRHVVYEFALAHDPRTFLPVLQRLFMEGEWSSAFGGKKWGAIVKAASLYFKMGHKPMLFADHCVDLAHNGGLAFNKGVLLKNPPDQTHYFAMLNQKREGSLLEWSSTLRVPNQIAVLVEALKLLGHCPPMVAELEPSVDTPARPMKWGKQPFTLETKHALSAVSPTVSGSSHKGYAAATELYKPRDGGKGNPA